MSQKGNKSETKLGQFEHPVKYELAAMQEQNQQQQQMRPFSPTDGSVHRKSLDSYDEKCSSTPTTSATKFNINMPLVPLKMTLFCWYAAGACLLPYMTLHMKQLGLTVQEMALIYAILPIVQLLAQPVAGFMADRFGNYKPVLLISLGTCIITTFILQVVPGRSKPSAMPSSNGMESSSPALETLSMVTFWLYLFVRTFHQVAIGFTYVLLDTTSLVLTEEHKSTYGRQRFWAILATGVFSPICGLVMDYVSKQQLADQPYDPSVQIQYTNFAPAFYFFNVLTAMTFLITLFIDMKISAPPRDVWNNVKPLLKSPSIWLFLSAVLVMGSCWGFLESFLFLHLQDLQAPNYMLGLTLTVGALIGLPFLYESEWFVNKFGAVNLLILALVFYFIRLIGYSLIYNPWLCIPFELMESFTLHLMWVATVRLAYLQSPPGMIATVQALVGGLNFAIGRGFGSLIGGSVFAVYGARIAFRVVGVMALTMALIYATCHYFCLAPLDESRRLRRTSLDSNESKSQSFDEERHQQGELMNKSPLEVKKSNDNCGDSV